MGSIVSLKRQDKATGKDVTVYRAFIRRKAGGKTISKSKLFKTKAQAKDWLRNHENDGTLAVLGKSSGPLFADVIESFVRMPPDRGTRYWSESHLDFWRDEFGGMKIGAITRGAINSCKAKLLVKDAMRNTPTGLVPTGKKLTPATVNRYLASLSSVFNYAVQHEIIDSHPMKGGAVGKLEESKGRRRILTADEEERLYSAARESEWPMMELFLRTCLTSGARKSEVLTLRWEHVQLEDSLAILPKTKNGDQRALPLVAEVRAGLEEAKKVRPLHSDFVFFDPRKPTRAKNVDTLWKNVRKRAGLWQDREDPLDRVVLHTTRHTAATKLVKSGANIGQVAAVTGHKTLSQLKRYTHFAARDAVDLAQKVLSNTKL